jgi:hypothetical protein
MDYSNLQEAVAARGQVFNDAATFNDTTTKLIAGVCCDNRASTMRDLRTRSTAGNRKPASLPRVISPPIAPTDHGPHRGFGHLFPRMRVMRFDRM